MAFEAVCSDLYPQMIKDGVEGQILLVGLQVYDQGTVKLKIWLKKVIIW